MSFTALLDNINRASGLRNLIPPAKSRFYFLLLAQNYPIYTVLDTMEKIMFSRNVGDFLTLIFKFSIQPSSPTDITKPCDLFFSYHSKMTDPMGGAI